MAIRLRFLTAAKRHGFRVERMGGNLSALAKDYPAAHGCIITAYIQLAGGDHAPTRWADGACQIHWGTEYPTDAPRDYVDCLQRAADDAWQDHADSGMAAIERADGLAERALRWAQDDYTRDARIAAYKADDAMRVRS